MARADLPSGVHIDAPETVRVSTQDSDRGSVDLPTGPVPIDVTGGPDLGAALAASDFEVVDRVVLTPTLEETPSSGVRRRSAPTVAGEQSVEISLDTPPGQDAVVLVEQDGVYSWVLPSEAGSPAATRSAAGQRTFSIELSPVARDIDPTRGFVSDLIYSRATAFVLRYVAPPLGRAAINHFEDVEEGIVVMSADGPSSWAHVEPGALSIPPGGRMLLFVHGTFSSTGNSFGPLWTTPEGRDLVALAHDRYDLVVGVDHRTLSVDPLENPRDIVGVLRAIPGAEDITIDALGYSRGGLVLRSVIENVMPSSGWSAKVERAVFVGSTHRGTLLASPEHWHRLVDLYTNLIVAGATGVGAVVPGAAAPAALIAGGLKLVGAAVKALATELIDEDTIPGLAAMLPDGPFVVDLNSENPGQPMPADIDYFAVTSNFDADDSTDSLPSRMKFILKDGLMDRLMGESNDLVVNTSSMTGMEAGYLKDTFEFGTNGTVFHTNYFQQAKTADSLRRWWDLFAETAALAPPVEGTPPSAPRTRGGPVASPIVAEPPPDGPAQTTEMSFAAGMDDSVVLGEVTSIEVRVGTDQIAGDLTVSASGEVELRTPLVLQVMCRRGFESAGPHRAETLPPSEGSLDFYFDVRATDVGTGQIDVVVRQGVVPILTLSLEPTVVEIAVASPGVAMGEGTAAAAAPLATPLHQLRINERYSEGRIVYEFDFESEELGLLIRGDSPPLQQDRQTYVARLFKEIEDRWMGSGQDAANFRQDIRAYGSSLFEELVPPEIQAALWEHRDQIEAIQVLSTEPFIPWEIVHLKEPGGALGPEEHFLGAKGLVRWLHGTWPPDEIRIRPARVRAVVPSYPEGTNFRLPEAEAELAFMKQQFGAEAVEPTVRDVRDLLSEPGSFDLLHFAGHGTAEQSDVTNARLMMQGRIDGGNYVPEFLNATTVSEFANLVGADGNRPLVVLNACQVGRAGYQLTGIGGFAAAFINRGAGAFVSSLWSVGDRPARTFTESFYAGLLARKSVTEAVIAARQAAADAGDATWLAYTVYAHPHAVIVPG